jgi:hypothetical protein
MSERLRQTQRIRHRARTDARHTLRAQVGGVRGSGESWYYVADPVRAEKWITNLRKAATILEDPVYAQLADVIDKKDWGTPTPELLDLYLHIVERQDTLFSIAIGIINKLLDVSPAAPDYADTVITKLRTKGADTEKAYKEYIYDVYNLIMCGSYPDLDRTTNPQVQFVTKLEGLQKETLSSILLWPARVKNILIDSIADILISLKANPSILDSAGSIKELFNDQYNAYIMTNAIEATSKGLRDGFYLWDEVKLSAAPYDDCAQASCEIKVAESIQFWINFYEKYISSSDDLIKRITSNIDIRGYMFSYFIADIFKKYKTGQTISDIRNEIISACASKSDKTPVLPTLPPSSKKPSFGTKEFRPAAVYTLNTATSSIMRVLTPEQYTFLYHLLYVIEQKEKETAASASST